MKALNIHRTAPSAIGTIILVASMLQNTALAAATVRCTCEPSDQRMSVSLTYPNSKIILSMFIASLSGIERTLQTMFLINGSTIFEILLS